MSAKRIVVVGASSGLGRTIGVHLGQKTAQVALLARRKDRLASAAEEAGPGTLAIACDVTDPASVQAAITEAAAGLGGIDAVVYAPGVGPLVRIEHLDAETLNSSFSANVTGAHLVTQAALPHLKAAHGTMVYLSSVIGSHTEPWPGLAAYAVSKAALERLIQAWRIEHPDVGFTRVTVGDTSGGDGESRTEFNNGWDRELMGQVYPTWIARNYYSGTTFDAVELLRIVEMVVHTGASANIPVIVVQPRQPQLLK